MRGMLMAKLSANGLRTGLHNVFIQASKYGLLRNVKVFLKGQASESI